jgi:uncharacterized protein YbjT (DUF2867 family)
VEVPQKVGRWEDAPDGRRGDEAPARGCCQSRRLSIRLRLHRRHRPRSSYPYRIKLQTERVVEYSPVPYTILRATQFYDLVLIAVRFLERLPVMVVPNCFHGQPMDAGEVADRLVELALSEPAGRVPDIGGPKVRTVMDIVRGYFEVKRFARER